MTSLWPQSTRLSHKLTLLALALIISIACKTAPTGEGESSYSQSQPQAVDNAGKRLKGAFSMKVATDEYSTKLSRDEAVITFDESGGFKREKRVAGVAEAVEEGGYVIGTRGEFVLFIEKVGGEFVEASRPERYSILEEAGSRLVLQAGPGVSFILERRE